MPHFLAMGSFASKVMSHVRLGFAAGCEAVAMPRQQHPALFAGYAPGPGFALRILWAKGRTKGITQNVKGASGRGRATASHPAAKPMLHRSRTFRTRLRWVMNHLSSRNGAIAR